MVREFYLKRSVPSADVEYQPPQRRNERHGFRRFSPVIKAGSTVGKDMAFRDESVPFSVNDSPFPGQWH
jgi:hypothetical protein